MDAFGKSSRLIAKVLRGNSPERVLGEALQGNVQEELKFGDEVHLWDYPNATGHITKVNSDGTYTVAWHNRPTIGGMKGGIPSSNHRASELKATGHSYAKESLGEMMQVGGGAPAGYDWQHDNNYRPHAESWIQQAKATGDGDYLAYVMWVVEHGHLMPNASSVLQAWADEKHVAPAIVQKLSKIMHF